jgi:hypothetical protein
MGEEGGRLLSDFGQASLKADSLLGSAQFATRPKPFVSNDEPIGI